MAYYELALFDADDTLFDFHAAAKNALRLALEKSGALYRAEMYDIYQKENQAVWEKLERGEIDRAELKLERFRRFFAAAGIPCPAELEQLNEDYMMALGEGGILLPGAEQLCKEVSALCRTAIVTNGFERVQKPRMERAGMSRWFERVYISEQVGFQKPRAEFFDAVLADLGVTDRRRVILLGDSLTSDMAGGLNAGIDTCWYNPGHQPRNGVFVTCEIDRLADFTAIIRDGPKKKAPL